jgi:hypothetical protein
VVCAVAAVRLTIAPFGPLTNCINRARHWLWITRPDITLANVVALRSTVLSCLFHVEVTGLCAIRSTLRCARLPRQPLTNAWDWAGMGFFGIARLFPDLVGLGLALLSTMLCRLGDDESGLHFSSTAGGRAI